MIRPYRKGWFWVLAAIIVIALFWVYKKATYSIEVKMAPVERKDLDFTVSATSTGTVKSETEIYITAQRTGRISELYVSGGDTVSRGDKVALIDPAEAELELNLSRAALKRTNAQLSEMKAALSAMTVEVETGLRKAEAVLREAEARYTSFKGLHEKGYISQMELISAEKQYDVARAALDAALSGRESLKAKEDEIRAQEAAVDEAESRVSLARLNYEYSFMKAPAPGVISSRPVKLGETVAKGALIATLVSTDSLYIESFVDEADVSKVSIGQRVLINMDAYPRETFTGEVTRISPVVLGGRQETRTFEVRVGLPVKNVILKPGMSADIEIVIQSVRDALVVTSQVVVVREGKKYVYVVEGGRARLREIKEGVSDWTYTEVLSGLKEGDIVVLTPDVTGLEDGARVIAQETG